MKLIAELIEGDCYQDDDGDMVYIYNIDLPVLDEILSGHRYNNDNFISINFIRETELMNNVGDMLADNGIPFEIHSIDIGDEVYYVDINIEYFKFAPIK